MNVLESRKAELLNKYLFNHELYNESLETSVCIIT